LWLEMSRDIEHGGRGWEFSRCLWAPSHKKGSNASWPFWRKLLEVTKDDVVLHLRGKTHEAAFVGFSIADTDGYKTPNHPSSPAGWDYARSYYRVPLKEFSPFPLPPLLDDVFSKREDKLKDYLKENRAKPGHERELLFYVLQSGKLQCLQGAYISEVSNRLASIIFDTSFGSNDGETVSMIEESVHTKNQYVYLRSRIGQAAFSENLRRNYGNKCCFPGCPINERDFLVGAHIARWADEPNLRGKTSNGLCFCLIHDRAFEKGLFTLTAGKRIHVNKAKAKLSLWARRHLLSYEGKSIRKGMIAPSLTALKYHWQRINCYPRDYPE